MRPNQLSVAFVASALATAVTHAIAFQNEPTGFRGIAWDTEFSAVESQMTLVEEGRMNTKYYRRNEDNMSIGGAELSKIVYEFFDGRFSSVIVETKKGTTNRQAIQGAFFAQFGSGSQPNRYMEQWFWHGSTSTVFLRCNRVRDECDAMMRSEAVHRRSKEADQKRAKDAKKDF